MRFDAPAGLISLSSMLAGAFSASLNEGFSREWSREARLQQWSLREPHLDPGAGWKTPRSRRAQRPRATGASTYRLSTLLDPLL